MKIGITGGIGSGKSYVCRLLRQRGIEVYDCDEAAKSLLRSSDSLKRRMRLLIGDNVYDADGCLNKKVVTTYLLSSDDHAHQIDAIVHPAVADDYRLKDIPWMECAIMFESGFNQLVDKVICVTAPEEVRVQRVMQRDGISREKALQWMAKQWPQDKVRHLSDYEIVNDGNTEIVPQIDMILHKIKK